MVSTILAAASTHYLIKIKFFLLDFFNAQKSQKINFLILSKPFYPQKHTRKISKKNKKKN